MAREPGQPSDPEKTAADAEASEAEARPAGDSEGVYYISVEDFERRLPRSNPPPQRPKHEEEP